MRRSHIFNLIFASVIAVAGLGIVSPASADDPDHHPDRDVAQAAPQTEGDVAQQALAADLSIRKIKRKTERSRTKLLEVGNRSGPQHSGAERIKPQHVTVVAQWPLYLGVGF